MRTFLTGLSLSKYFLDQFHLCICSKACVSCIWQICRFTQLFVFSLLSKSFFCRTSPTPPGAPNFSTMAFVFLNCSSFTRCWTHFKYVSRVCFSGGTGTFGNTCLKKQQTGISMHMKDNNCSVFYVFPH